MAELRYVAYCQEDYDKPITEMKEFYTDREAATFFGLKSPSIQSSSTGMHSIKGKQPKMWKIFKGDVPIKEIEALLGEEVVNEFYRR